MIRVEQLLILTFTILLNRIMDGEKAGSMTHGDDAFLYIAIVIHIIATILSSETAFS